jgi:hypothetical protein
LELPTSLAKDKSPKSSAFPVELMVTKSILFTLPEGSTLPPPKHALIELVTPSGFLRPDVKFPNSVAFPADARVIK